MIPQADLRAAYLADKEEIDEAMARVMASGWYILGPEVAAFEDEFAEWSGAKYAVGVANGTDAIALALKAVGCQPGDNVATVSHTVSATVAAVEQAGCIPVLVDIERMRMTMCPRDLRDTLEAIPGIECVLPVHIYGQPADMPQIRAICDDYGVKLVDDCAHAFGAMIHNRRIGAWADASAFSFYPTKNLACFGDGGIVTTNSDETAEQLKLLRQYCWDTRYISEQSGGVDSRLDELQAAILRVRLKKLDARNERRKHIAHRYNLALLESGISDAKGIYWKSMVAHAHAMHLYVARITKRDEFRAYLGEHGISTNVHFPVPAHLQPAYKDRVALGPAKCAETEKAAAEVVTLPLYPEMTDEQVETVCVALKGWEP